MMESEVERTALPPQLSATESQLNHTAQRQMLNGLESSSEDQEDIPPAPVSAGHKARTDDSDDEDVLPDDLELTADQRLAMMELGSMKLDLGYTEEDPPEYDVAERVRKLNEELANDPLPEEDERERSIKFKETLVDLVAPPYDYSDEDDDDENGERREDENGATGDGGERAGERDERPSDGRTDASCPDEERVLVERNGVFELLSADALSADERRLYGIDEAATASPAKTRERAPSEATLSPDAEDRSASATPSSGRGRKQASGGAARRPQSAGYVSPYAQNGGGRSTAERRSVAHARLRQRAEEAEREKENERRREGEEAFDAWLRQKRDANAQQRRQTAESEREARRQADDSKADDSRSGFNEWLKAKIIQRRQQAKEHQREMSEYNEGWYVRPRTLCDHAFKDWLKRKNAESSRRRLDRPKARNTRLHNYRNKSQPMTGRPVSRHVDYYGYRF